MDDEAQFLDELTAEFMEQGYDRQTAGHFAVLTGDTPVTDGHGNLLIMDRGQILAVLKMPKMFQPDN